MLQRNRTAALAAMALGLSGAMAGCSSFKDPTIGPRGASMIQKTDEALAFRVAIELNNPNAEPLKLLDFIYDVKVDGVSVYEGMRAAETTLASNGRKEVWIPVVVRFDAMKWASEAVPPAAKYEIHGKLRYDRPGEFITALLGHSNAGFAWSGTVELAPVSQ